MTGSGAAVYRACGFWAKRGRSKSKYRVSAQGTTDTRLDNAGEIVESADWDGNSLAWYGTVTGGEVVSGGGE